MALLSFSASTTAPTAALRPTSSSSNVSTSSSSSSFRRSGVGCFLSPLSLNSSLCSKVRARRSMVVCMAPDEEKMTRRSPLDFPIVCFSRSLFTGLIFELWVVVVLESNFRV